MEKLLQILLNLNALMKKWGFILSWGALTIVLFALAHYHQSVAMAKVSYLSLGFFVGLILNYIGFKTVK